MSYYTTLELSQNQFNDIIAELEFAVEKKTDYHEIVDLVHLIDALYDKYNEDYGRQNQQLRDHFRYQELKESGKYMKSDLFLPIHDIISKIDMDDENGRFYATCKLIDLIDDKRK